MPDDRFGMQENSHDSFNFSNDSTDDQRFQEIARGEPGPPGPPGPAGPAGADGTVSFDELTPAQRESLRGPKGDPGDPGADGTTFIPSVNSAGDLSWTNDGGKQNPPTVNIKGPKGDAGADGSAGKSAYQSAVDGGYTGTETQFNANLASMPAQAQAISAIEAKIPATASAVNQLMDAAAVNSAIASAVEGITGFSFEIVQALPSTGEAGVIYLLPHTGGQTPNVYDEYIWIGTGFEQIGTTEIDLTGYATETWVQQQGYYSKLAAGIPRTDLASDVQASLVKADSALQSVPSTYRTAAAQDAIDANLMALGLTGAAFGDLVRVNAVDANGKPTSWKRVPLNEIKCNKNLLDNWYFIGGGSQLGYGVFPINQRGQTSYSNTGYTFDRWKLTSGSMSITANGITLNGTLEQILEANIGQTVTASALLSDGTMITPVYNDTTMTFTLSATGQTIKAVKLELGSEQTLAHQENGVWVLNEIPNYQTELTKCMAYFQRIGVFNDWKYYNCVVRATGSSGIICLMAIPIVPMRKTPTVTTSSTELQVANYPGGPGSGIGTITGVFEVGYSRGDGLINIQFNCANSLTVGKVAYAFIGTNGSGSIDLSAE